MMSIAIEHGANDDNDHNDGNDGNGDQQKGIPAESYPLQKIDDDMYQLRNTENVDLWCPWSKYEEVCDIKENYRIERDQLKGKFDHCWNEKWNLKRDYDQLRAQMEQTP